MKTPSFIEFQTIVEYIKDELIGSQLQEIMTTTDGAVLTFYRFVKEPKTVYLVFDLDNLFPFVGLYPINPWPGFKKIKPLGLFLNSHFKNLYLRKVELSKGQGRVVHFIFGSEEDERYLEFRMIPKNMNLIVKSQDKTLSWAPVKQLLENFDSQQLSVTQSDKLSSLALLKSNEEVEVRSIPLIFQLWLSRRSHAEGKLKEHQQFEAASPYEKWKKQRERDLIKKQKAVETVRDQIHKFQSEPWAEVGEYLKIYGMQNLRPEWYQYLNFEKSTSQNIQQCFLKSKAANAKLVGAQKRLHFLKEELENIKDVSEDSYQKYLIRKNEKSQAVQVRKLDGRFRKLDLEDENLTCYMGKSAQDNVSLLRKSRAWDIWLHLKDYPSAYAIIHREKRQKISDQSIQMAARWLVKEGLGAKKSLAGAKLSVVFVETRHVRPIKGDKLGRVTYHNAREILITV